MRRIRVSYEVISPESSENGEAERSGWQDEQGIEIVPDEYDVDEYDNYTAAVIALAAKFIGAIGAVEASCSEFGGYSRIWYTSIDPEHNYQNGEETRYSYFLDEFSEVEQRGIYQQLTGRKA